MRGWNRPPWHLRYLAPVRVLHITTSFPRHRDDVSGTFVHRLVEHLAGSGMEVEVIAPGAPDAATQEAMGHVRVARPTYLLPRSLQRLAYGFGIPENVRRRRWVALQAPFLLGAFLRAAVRRARRFDVVHAHWTPSGLVAAISAALTRTPFVVTIWGSDVRTLPRWLNRWILRRAGAVIGLSREMEVLAAELGIDAISIPSPVDTSRFNDGVDGSLARAELGIEPGAGVVVFVGRLADEKGPMTLVEAAPTVIDRLPDTHFVLVGGGALGEALRLRSQELGVAHHVHLVGPRRDVERYLGAADVFAALSPVENMWSTTITEATFAGRPMVLTDAGHTSEVFTDHVDCLLVPPRQPSAVAAAIVELLEDRALAMELVEGSRQLHRRHGYDNDWIVAAHLAIYDAVAARSQVSVPPHPGGAA